jgi:hypothetical protein
MADDNAAAEGTGKKQADEDVAQDRHEPLRPKVV